MLFCAQMGCPHSIPDGHSAQEHKGWRYINLMARIWPVRNYAKNWRNITKGHDVDSMIVPHPSTGRVGYMYKVLIASPKLELAMRTGHKRRPYFLRDKFRDPCWTRPFYVWRQYPTVEGTGIVMPLFITSTGAAATVRA